MAAKEDIYKVVHEADVWITVDEIRDEISDDYTGISRLSIRESLADLQDEGFVEKGQNLKFRAK